MFRIAPKDMDFSEKIAFSNILNHKTIQLYELNKAISRCQIILQIQKKVLTLHSQKGNNPGLEPRFPAVMVP